jgi:hypothetical protein
MAKRHARFVPHSEQRWLDVIRGSIRTDEPWGTHKSFLLHDIGI